MPLVVWFLITFRTSWLIDQLPLNTIISLKALREADRRWTEKFDSPASPEEIEFVESMLKHLN